MSAKPDFEKMTSIDLRAYVLEHRDDQAALQAYLDKRHAENSDSRVYQPEESIGDAIAEQLEKIKQKQV
jgi:hypothetical protein